MHRTTAFAIATLAATSALVLAGLAGPATGLALGVQPGTSHHVQVVDSQRLGVLAGLVTETPRQFLGLELGSPSPATTGYALVAVEGQPLDPEGPLSLTDAFPFTDPNGGRWEAIEIHQGGTVAWAVPVGPALEDDTLGQAYNWALVVDWDEVPEDKDLEVTWVADLPVQR